MKKILAILLVILILSCSLMTVSAVSIDITDTGKTVVDYGDWILEKINSGTQWELDEYKGTDTEVDVPRIIDNKLVVSFGNYCFANNSSVKSVITSSPLWTIGEYAFIDCTALEKFECNYGMKTIGIGAFSGTSSLKDVNLEDSIITVVNPYTFLNSGIEHVELPETCTEIMKDAFAQCHELTSIFIPDSVTTIHEDAFRQSDNVVIYCNTDSYAHEFAEAKSIPYILLDSPNTVRFLLGDADNDGVVTISDVTLIQRVLAELEQDDDGMIELRVTNGEEKLNIFNATEIQRYLARLPIERTIDILIIKSLV